MPTLQLNSFQFRTVTCTEFVSYARFSVDVRTVNMLTLICCQLRQWIWTGFCYYYYHNIIEVAHSIDLTIVYVSKNMQSGLRIAHSSLMKAVCQPNPAHDLSRAFWLARTQTPWIVRVHHWMLLDQTTTLSPFNSTCITWVSTVRMCCVAHASFSTISFKTV